MHDSQIIRGLIERDERVTERFFFRDCRPLFVSVIRKIFDYEVDYDEFVNEFYVYLMDSDAARLSQFEGRSSLFQWMKVVAIRYFWVKRSKMIEDRTKDALVERYTMSESVDSGRGMMAKMDVEALLERMDNPRQVYMIRRLILDDAEPETVAKELKVTVDNLYNIKKRALAALTKIALKS